MSCSIQGGSQAEPTQADRAALDIELLSTDVQYVGDHSP